MNRHLYFLKILSIVCVLFLAGCSVAESFFPTTTPTSTPDPTATPFPPLATATLEPTQTVPPFYLSATYFSGDLQVPILIYHQFFPSRFGPTTSTKMQLSEFRNELQTLYDNNFSLISLKSWIDGTFIVPPGKKPLIITMDDLWFANQLFIQPDGIPSELSGIGIMWQFSQEHPDFGFHVAGFAIMGDKLYAYKQVEDEFFTGDNETWNSKTWKKELGATIAWAIDHGVEVYNHTLLHPNLSMLPNSEIQRQLSENDYVLREFLEMVNRADLIPQLDNVLALPQGIWPSTQSGKNVILNYKNPEGKPMMAVMEAYNMDAAQFTPSYFSPKFNPYAIPRITASPYMIEYIVQNMQLIPTAQICQLGPLSENQQYDQDIIQKLISATIQAGTCPEGVYHVNGYIFIARDGNVLLHFAPQGEVSINNSEGVLTPTP